MARLAFVAFVFLGPQWLLISGEETRFTNKWVAEIHGGEAVAERVARDLGYTFKGQVGSLENYYLMTRSDHPEVSSPNSEHLTRSLLNVDEVKWAKQQKIIERTKRGYIPKVLPLSPMGERDLQTKLLMKTLSTATGNNPKINLALRVLSSAGYSANIARKVLDCLKSGKALIDCGVKLPGKLYKRLRGTDQGDLANLGKFSTRPMEAAFLKKHRGVTKNIGLNSKKVSAYADMFNDPLWKRQWYMQDYRTEDGPVMDHNVVPVYKMDITGKGVTVAVVDDGVIHNHEDLVGNFDEELSYDMCHDRPGSAPGEDGLFTNSHGTECAGEIAMVANNNICGVGMAYNVKIAGILTLCPNEDEVMESKSLIHALDKIDIYSCSWGPSDDGKSMTALPDLTKASFDKGTIEGRGGKGALYVFASGNGKAADDNCGADYIVNHISSIPIASASQKGKITFYSERCAAVFATAYSGGNLLDEDNASTSAKSCTRRFSGTSASVPLASSMLALTLQANPRLTQRDVMHLITMTSEVAPLANNKNTWFKNGKGFWVSNDFGFGLLNGENLVLAAKNWDNVPMKTVCTINIKPDEPHHLTLKKHSTITFDTKLCQETKANSINYLEHVEVIATIKFPGRGCISMYMTSPQGTKTTLLETRKSDKSPDGYNGWTIMSVQNWGEHPKGKWEIVVKAHDLHDVDEDPGGYVTEITVNFHGTVEKPKHYPKIGHKFRKYSAFRLKNGKTSES